MKTPRFILVGLVLLVAGLGMWLQLSSGAGRPSPARVAVSIDRGPTDVHVEASAPATEELPEPKAQPATVPGKDPSTLPPGFERRQLLERSGFDAAALGADAAMQKLSNITERADRYAFIRGMFARLASGKPADNVKAIKKLENELEQETALAALVATLRPDPMPVSGQAGDTRAYGNVGGILAGLLLPPGDPATAVEYANLLLSGIARAKLLGAAADREAVRDPQHALSFGAGLQGKERSEFMTTLASGWGFTSGEAAWNWAQQEPDAALRSTMQTAVLEGWTQKDPATAARYAAQIQDAEERQKAIKLIGQEWAGVDTQAAMTWAGSLSADERTAASEAIASSAPVGIGVSLTMGPEGYPVVAGLIPGGSASAVGGLKDGFQIAAVGDGSGRFTDVQGKDLSDITSMIRGKPGSSVWLQVVQPGGNSTDRTTVVIPRRQLMFKRQPGA